MQCLARAIAQVQESTGRTFQCTELKSTECKCSGINRKHIKAGWGEEGDLVKCNVLLKSRDSAQESSQLKKLVIHKILNTLTYSVPPRLLIWHVLDYITFFHHYQGSIDFNTVNIHRTVGMYFLVSTGSRGGIE